MSKHANSTFTLYLAKEYTQIGVIQWISKYIDECKIDTSVHQPVCPGCMVLVYRACGSRQSAGQQRSVTSFSINFESGKLGCAAHTSFWDLHCRLLAKNGSYHTPDCIEQSEQSNETTNSSISFQAVSVSGLFEHSNI